MCSIYSISLLVPDWEENPQMLNLQKTKKREKIVYLIRFGHGGGKVVWTDVP